MTEIGGQNHRNMQLGKSYDMVNSYAKNRRQPSIEILFKIAQILEGNPKDLLKTDYIK